MVTIHLSDIDAFALLLFLRGDRGLPDSHIALITESVTQALQDDDTGNGENMTSEGAPAHPTQEDK
jgi:hypothetical protein